MHSTFDMILDDNFRLFKTLFKKILNFKEDVFIWCFFVLNKQYFKTSGMLQSLCPQMSTRQVFYPEPCYPEDTWTQCFGLQTVPIQPSHLFPLLACLSSCSTFETVSERATWLQTFMLMSLRSDSKEERYDFVAKRVYILVTWIILHCCFKLSDRNRFLKN